MTERASAVTISAEQKTVYLKHFKSTFATWRRKLDDPLVFLEVLPSSPCDLQAAFPNLWSSWFTCGDLPSCEMPQNFLKDLQMVEASYQCRSRGNQSAKQPDSTTGTKFCQDVIHAVLESQRQMLQTFTGNRPQFDLTTGGGNLPACLRPSIPSQSAFPVRPLQLTDQPLRRALTVPDSLDDEAVWANSSPEERSRAVSRLVPLPPPPPPAAPRVSSATRPFPPPPPTAAPPVSQATGSLDDITGLLDAMTARKSCKRKPENEVTVHEPCASGLDQDSHAKGKTVSDQHGEKAAPQRGKAVAAKKKCLAKTGDKAASTSLAGHGKKGATKLDSQDVVAPATTVGNDTKMAKDCDKAAVKALKGVGKDRAKKSQRQEVGPAAHTEDFGAAAARISGKGTSKGKGDGRVYEFGCSKCRWGKGCAQCRNPNFSGKRFSYCLL